IGQSVLMGYAAGADTAAVRALVWNATTSRMWPRDTELLWTAKPEQVGADGQGYYGLIAVRRQVELTGEGISEARPDFDPATNAPQVSMTMNPEAARVWARITGANINKPIAIVLDD